MAYSRQPNVTIAGRGLTQNPAPNPVAPAGIIQVGYDSNIATTSSLGIVQVGSGLSITPLGVLSATGGGGSGAPIFNVYLTAVSYIPLPDDCYVGATTGGITITLPLGVLDKLYISKNQAPSGNITVTGSGGQKLDNSTSKIVGSEGVLLAVFDGTRWNLI